MSEVKKPLQTVDTYISALDAYKQSVFHRIRQMVKARAPDCTEKISYGIPAFKRKGIILWFGAFNDHFSMFPPIHGDEALALEAKPYANDKGNLIFYFRNPLPLELFERVIAQKVHQNELKIASKKKPVKR
ncbi:MAG: iron chaperone [bacterium]